MSHTDYIIIILGASLMLTMGVCVAIREVNHYARSEENVLTRRGDIELGDYIEPTRPLQVHDPRNLDLISPQWPTYQRVSTHAPSYETGAAPSYQTGTLPSYQSDNRLYIYSSLEDSINLDYILIILCYF
jgi:hypothetical protein